MFLEVEYCKLDGENSLHIINSTYCPNEFPERDQNMQK
jgi:hypothetical protein